MYHVDKDTNQYEIWKKIKEGYVELQFDKVGNMVNLKGYCKAKDFQNVMERLK